MPGWSTASVAVHCQRGAIDGCLGGRDFQRGGPLAAWRSTDALEIDCQRRGPLSVRQSMDFLVIDCQRGCPLIARWSTDAWMVDCQRGGPPAARRSTDALGVVCQRGGPLTARRSTDSRWQPTVSTVERKVGSRLTARRSTDSFTTNRQVDGQGTIRAANRQLDDRQQTGRSRAGGRALFHRPTAPATPGGSADERQPVGGTQQNEREPLCIDRRCARPPTV